MSHPVRVCIVGDVIVDVSLTQPPKMRLGGVFHAVRALWAAGIDFDLALIVPEYISDQAVKFGRELGARQSVVIGKVDGAPNLIIIPEPTEAGPQGYEQVLRDEYACTFMEPAILEKAIPPDATDVLIFPGAFDLEPVMRVCASRPCRVHVDVANANDTRSLSELGRKISSFILSTSSDIFLSEWNGDIASTTLNALGLSDCFLFKENRGGSRIFTQQAPEKPISIGAHLRPIVHSVGVGDVYDAIFVGLQQERGEVVAAHLAALIAAEYACTTYPDAFRAAVTEVLTLEDDVVTAPEGVVLPWEARDEVHVYIAAPDFDYVDRAAIDAVENALRYHNFVPHRPIQENGQAQTGDTALQRATMFEADMALISRCNILVAVLINDDPGTLVEIGLAAGLGKPTIVYDPSRMCSNIMLAHLPSTVSPNLDEIISAVFKSAAQLDRC